MELLFADLSTEAEDDAQDPEVTEVCDELGAGDVVGVV
jgi:hypothetical protein